VSSTPRISGIGSARTCGIALKASVKDMARARSASVDLARVAVRRSMASLLGASFSSPGGRAAARVRGVTTGTMTTVDDSVH